MSEYVVVNGELYHYGVKGMKWGVHKSVYKSMNKQQRKETRQKYRQTPEYKIKRATTIGTILGGPLGGAIAGTVSSKRHPLTADQTKNVVNGMSSKKINDVSDKQISKGKNVVDNVKNTKIETDEQKIMRLKAEGKIGPNAHYTFDQNGDLFMVTWD